MTPIFLKVPKKSRFLYDIGQESRKN